jgi:hypothetical protein
MYFLAVIYFSAGLASKRFFLSLLMVRNLDFYTVSGKRCKCLIVFVDDNSTRFAKCRRFWRNFRENYKKKFAEIFAKMSKQTFPDRFIFNQIKKISTDREKWNFAPFSLLTERQQMWTNCRRNCLTRKMDFYCLPSLKTTPSISLRRIVHREATCYKFLLSKEKINCSW